MTVDLKSIVPGAKITCEFVVRAFNPGEPDEQLIIEVEPLHKRFGISNIHADRVVSVTPPTKPLPSELPDGAYIIQKCQRGAGLPRYEVGPIWKGHRMITARDGQVLSMGVSVLNASYEAE